MTVCDTPRSQMPNSRNGTSAKTLATEIGPVPLAVPRDRAGTFEPRLVPKGARRAGGLDEMIISFYAGGMTICDIQHHLARTIGTGLPPELRHIIKSRGHFPSDDAVIKLLWLAIRDIEDKRARAREAEKAPPRHRKAPAQLVEGAVVQGWRHALGALSLRYPDRLAPYLS